MSGRARKGLEKVVKVCDSVLYDWNEWFGRIGSCENGLETGGMVVLIVWGVELRFWKGKVSLEMWRKGVNVY